MKELSVPFDALDEKRREATKVCNDVTLEGIMRIHHECQKREVSCQIGKGEWINALCNVEVNVNIMSLAIFLKCNV